MAVIIMADKDITKLSFPALHERAEAIRVVAAQYPAEEISAEVIPMRTPEEAVDAYSRTTVKPIGTKGAGGFNKNLGNVQERYMKLGEAGTSSLVVLEVTDGIQNFDFTTFYGQVDEQLRPKGS